MAGGGKVAGWSSPKPRKVLVIDGEMNTQDLQDRTRYLLDTGAVRDIDRAALMRNLVFMPRQAQDPEAMFYDITDEGSQRRIMKRMAENDAEVVIVDNLTTCADGLDDENDATAFREVMKFLLMMKQGGKTAILVHHARKDGSDARGSTAIEATFEVKLGLHKPKVSRPDVASFITHFGKKRTKGDDSTSNPKVWTLTDFGWTVEDVEGVVDNRVVEALKSLEYVNQSELAGALGITQGAVSKALKKAAELGQPKKEEIDRLFTAARKLRLEEADPFEDPDTDADAEEPF